MKKLYSPFLLKTAFVVLFMLSFVRGWGQVSIGALPYTKTDNFNLYTPTNLANATSSIPVGWAFSSSGAPAYRGITATPGTNGGYYGFSTTSDSSLGALRTGSTGNITYTVNFTNNTGQTITSLVVNWKYEQWSFSNTSGWNVSGTGALASNATLNAADFTGATTGSAGAATPISLNLTGLNITNGQSFGITWVTVDVTSTDNAVSIDDFSVTASNTPPTYSLTYNGNTSDGGVVPTDVSSPYAPSSTVTVLGNTGSLIKTCATFNGWNTAANGSGTSYAAGNTFNINANTTLFAQWTSTLKTITFNSNSGSGTITAQSACTAEAIKNNTFTRTGYTFTGWNTAANGTGTAYANGAAYGFVADITLHAQWSVNAYILSYDGNGNNGGTVNTGGSYNYNSTITMPATTVTRTGYTFAGWNTQANGSGTNYLVGASYTMPAANTTLFAKWKPNNYQVIFNGNGNTGGSMTNQTIAYNVNANLTTNAFTKTGYAFKEWTTMADGSGTAYANSASFTMNTTADVNLHAQWEVYVGPCLSESFTGTTYPPAGWLNTSTSRSTNAADYISAPAGVVFDSNSGELTLPVVSNPSLLMFYLGRSSNSTAKALTVEVSTSSQTTGFTPVATFNHTNVPSGTYNQYTVDLSAYSSFSNVWMRFVKTSNTTSPWRLDDVEVFCASSVLAPEITVTPSGNFAFGNQLLGTSSPAASFTITNTGTSGLTLGTIALSNTNADQFAVTQPAVTTLAPGSNTTFTATFTPTSPSDKTATVTIPNNTGMDYAFNLTGIGQCVVAPVITMTPTSGPANTVVTLSSAVNDLTGAVVKLNGVAITSESVTSGEIKIKIPVNAVDGNITLILQTGCVFAQAFNVITYDDSSCEGVATGALPTDLIIYEVYDENGLSGGYLSIYNGTSSAKNLENYDIYKNKDDGTFMPYTVDLSGVIAPGELKILRVKGDNKCDLPAATGNGQISGGFNEDDVFRLTNIGGTVVYDEVRTPNRVGYYMKRVEGKLGNNLVHDPTSWTSTDVEATDCLPGGVAPAMPGGVLPLITEQPNFAPTCQSIVLTVSASEGFSGGNALAYQWYYNVPGTADWTPIDDGGVYSGATGTILTISSASGLNNYQYYAQVRENTAACYIASNAIQIKDTETKWTATGWSNGTPTSVSKVILERNYDTLVDGDLHVCSLEIASGYELKIKPDGYVIVEYEIKNKSAPEKVIVESDGNLLQVNDSAVNSGDITVLRNSPMKKNNYTYWSSPVSGRKLQDFSPLTAPVRFYEYIESTNLFKTVPWANNFIPTKGYAIMAPATYTLTALQTFEGKFVGVPTNGTQFKTDAVTTALEFPLALSSIGGNQGYNLIGNPYPSNIDFEVLHSLNSSKIYNTAYFWTNVDPNRPGSTNGTGNSYSGNAYAIYNGTGGVSSTASAGALNGGPVPTQYIKVGQGFIVKSKVNAQPLIFNNSIRNSAGSSTFFSKGAASAKDRFWLKLTTPALNVNTILIGYVPGATNDFEWDYDAPLFLVASDSFYSLLNDDKLGIQGRTYPLDRKDVVALGTKHFEVGNYTLSLGDHEGIFASGQAIYLKDKETGTITNLTEGGSYTFAIGKGEFTNRFEIIYEPEIVLVTDAVVKDELQVYRDGSDFVVKAQNKKITDLQVIDASGRLILTTQPNNKEVRINSELLVQGVYILRIMQGNDLSIKKIIK